MTTPYTHKNLTEIEDSAAKFGYGEIQEARFAKRALDTEQTGVSYYSLRPAKRQPFAHRHNEAEEIYVVLSGSGRVKLDDEIIELRPLDAIRVAPGVVRAFEAGPEGLDVLAFGPRRDDDRGEMSQDWWSD